MFNVLDGDGVIDNIYHFLWTKDTIFNTDPHVYIPHTILYKYQKPCYWYFTSVVDNKLKKKNANKLKNEYIREEFLKHVSKSGIIAYYIYKKVGIQSKYETDKPNFEKVMKNLFSHSENNENNENSENNNIKSSYIIEYFNLKKFNDFLDKNIIYNDGILQKFVDSKGEHNVTYRLTWSPKICLFEKCSNLKKIFDNHYDIYERAVTYDGEEFQTKTEPIKGKNISNRLEEIGLSIVNHVSNITLEKIKIVRMILNFKLDPKDRMIFLWCSSLRIKSSNTYIQKNEDYYQKNFSEKKIKEADSEKIKIRPPENINIFKYNISGKSICPHQECTCLNCGQKVEYYRLYEITFRTLIEGHDNRKRDTKYFPIFEKINMTSCGVEVMNSMRENIDVGKENEVVETLKKNKLNNFIIPKVIQEIYPKLKPQLYFQLKNDTIFGNQITCVCDDCYLEITKYCSMAGSNNEHLLKTIKNIGKIYNNSFAEDVNKFRPNSECNVKKNEKIEIKARDKILSKNKDIKKNMSSKDNMIKIKINSMVKTNKNNMIKLNKNSTIKTNKNNINYFPSLTENVFKKNKNPLSQRNNVLRLNLLDDDNTNSNLYSKKKPLTKLNYSDKNNNEDVKQNKKNTLPNLKVNRKFAERNLNNNKKINILPKMKNFLSKNDFTYFN